MTPEIDAIKTTIRQLRADLMAAERALADAYGPRVDRLADLLCSCFDSGELRRLTRYSLGPIPDPLPEQGSLVALARASAVAFAEAKVNSVTLKSVLLRERPNRATDIEAGLKDWGAT